MLNVHVLNAGKGDSIILEHRNAGLSHFGIIDSCNIPKQASNRILDKLKFLGAKEISFVALTHPHSDHYTGLYEVLKAFPVKQFYSFPVTAFAQGAASSRLNNLCAAYMEARRKTDVEPIRKNIEEFVKILVHVRDKIGEENWHEAEGLENRLYPQGFDGSISLKSLLPMRKFKGELFQILDGKTVEYIETPDLNRFSLAFSLEYMGCKVVLGGDAVGDVWMEHKRQVRFANANAIAAKLPHHGSKKDSTPDVLDYIFGEANPNTASDKRKIALISAIGDAHHPAQETLTAIEDRGIHPYCTNFSVHCGAKVKHMVSASGLDPKMNSFLSMHVEPAPPAVQPCQGDICLTIDAQGQISVSRQYDNFCPYRDGDIFK